MERPYFSHKHQDRTKKSFGFDSGMIVDRESVRAFLKYRHRIIVRSLVLYLLLSLAWIYTSDYFLFISEWDLSEQLISVYKGWLFVLASTVFFYLMLRQRRLVYEKAIDTLDEYQQELNVKTHIDQLTHLPNRQFLDQEISSRIKRELPNLPRMGILYLDIDDFRVANELGGYSAGNAVLCHVANTLQTLLRPTDMAVRLSADEFAVLLEPLLESHDLLAFSERLQERLRHNWQIKEDKYFLTLSAGASICPEHGTQANELLQNAEQAMLNSKALGKNFTSLYYPGIQKQATQLTDKVTELRESIHNGRLEAHYQPQYDLKTGKLRGVEALVRCYDSESNMMMPDMFIPLAESTGLIDDLTHEMTRLIASQAEKWAKEDIIPPVISLNISSRQLQDDGLITMVVPLQRALQTLGSCLELEITESVLMENPESAISLIRKLRTYGIKFALDDFGTGYSSLTWLRELPVDVVKIDRQFINLIQHAKDDLQIVSAIINLVHSLGLAVIAEGIETKEQLDWLAKIGCDCGQGYYLAKPADPVALKLLIQQKHYIENKN